MNRDQKFFDMYSLVIGVLLIIALLIYVGVTKLSDMTQGIYTADSAEYQAAVADRLRPFGQVYMPGEEESAGEPVVPVAQVKGDGWVFPHPALRSDHFANPLIPGFVFANCLFEIGNPRVLQISSLFRLNPKDV